MPPAIDIGRLAVEKGLLTRAQLEQCAQEAGPRRPIGDIMVARGLLSLQQLQELARAAPAVQTPVPNRILPYACGRCQLRYDLVGADASRQYRCKKCDGLLTPSPRPAGERADEIAAGRRLEVPIRQPMEVAEAAKDPRNHFGRYIILRALGRGGMGTVYKAYDPALRRTVALKVLNNERPEAVARFQREARTVARFKHPNIVSIYEIGCHENAQYIAMEFVEGPTLDRLGKIPVRRAADLLRDVALAVQYAHDHGIIHRDLKPQNIIIDIDGRPYVTDFGLAREIRRGHTITAEGFTVGTPAYMSPEQATGQRDLDVRTDVYALGGILYHALTERAPFGGQSDLETAMNVVNKDLTAPTAFNSLIPRELEAICLKAMSKDRRSRYLSAQAFAQDLERWLAGQEVNAKPVSPMRRAIGRFLRNTQLVLTVAAVVIIASISWMAVSMVRASRQREQSARDTAARQAEDETKAREWLRRAKEASSPADRIDLAGRAIALWPECADAFFLRAVARRALDDVDGAMQDFAMAARHSPAPVQALSERADLAMKTGRVRDAVADYARALRIEPDAPGLRLRLAAAHVTHGDSSSALGVLDALESSPDVLGLRSMSLMLRGMFDEAVEAARRALPSPAGLAARGFVYARRGEAAARQGDLNGIVEALIVTETETQLDAAHFLTPLAREAIDGFREQVERLQSERPELRRSIGTALAEAALESITQRTSKERASALLEAALARDSENALAWAYRGLAYVQQKKFDEAVPCANRALQIDPDCAAARGARAYAHWGLLGQAFSKQGRSAELSLEHYVEGSADFQEFLAHSPQRDSLRPIFDEAMKAGEGLAAGMLAGVPAFARPLSFQFEQRARQRHEAADFACAAALFTRAIALNPAYPNAYVGRARSYAASGQWNKARHDLQKALELNPSLENELGPLAEEIRRGPP
ncbi:MAG: protein kinase [Planctomycetes bacterium]|nr:protein kinase [Planctomycetota bacterium]